MNDDKIFLPQNRMEKKHKQNINPSKAGFTPKSIRGHFNLCFVNKRMKNYLPCINQM